MLFVALFGNLLLLFFDSNGKSESLYDEEKYSAGIVMQRQYRGDKQSDYLMGVDFYFKQSTRFFRPKIGFYSTENGTSFISAGISKDVKIINRMYVFTYLLPSVSFISGKNKINNSGVINFNIGIGLSYLVTNDVALSLEWRHISNASTHMPNHAIEAVGLSLKVKI